MIVLACLKGHYVKVNLVVSSNMKEKKVWPLRECKICKRTFKPKNNSQTHCKNPCSSKKTLTIAESNAVWLSRTEEDRKRRFKNGKENFHRGQTRII